MCIILISRLAFRKAAADFITSGIESFRYLRKPELRWEAILHDP